MHRLSRRRNKLGDYPGLIAAAALLTD